MIALPNVGIREQRALALGIGASIVLHAMVLLVAPGFKPKEYVPELPTLTAVLRAQAQPETPAAAVSPQEPVTPPKPITEPPKPRAVTPPPSASAPVLSAPSSSPAPSVPAAADTPSEAKAGPAAPASAPPTTIASAAPSAASASAEPADPYALQNYKIQLASFAQKYQRYPRQALEQKWEGITEVKITIGENGRIRDAVVAKSSGHDELDQEAIAMVRKGAPLTEIKGALRKREFSINLEVVFQVKRAGG